MGIYGSIAHHNLCRRDYTRRREVPDGWYSTGDGMIGHFLGAIDGYGKHSDAYIHGSGKLRKAIGSIHLHRIDFRSYPFGIDVDSSDNIQSIPLQA